MKLDKRIKNEENSFMCEHVCSSGKWFSLPIEREKWSLFVGHLCSERIYVMCTLKHWHCNIENNNFKNFTHSEKHVENLKINAFKMENWVSCELNKVKQKPVPKDYYTRATRTLNIAETDIFTPIHKIAVDGHGKVIGL